MPNHRSSRTRICANCSQPFPLNLSIGGQRKHFHKRKYCFECSPLGADNRKILELHNATHRVCTACHQKKPVKDFFCRKRGDRTAYCKICHSRKGTIRRQYYKVEAVAYKGGKCQHCEYATSQNALEFHHIDPTKKDFTFSAKSRSFESAKAELDKCLLLCARCHRKEHLRILPVPDPGTPDPSGPLCTRCEQHKTIESFPIRSTGKPSSWCHSCTTENQRARRREIKQKLVDYSGGRCQQCGYDECHDALEFHHLDPKGKDPDASLLRKRLPLVKAEIDKCILICVNCHREIHEAQAA